MMKITGAMGSIYSMTEEKVDRFLKSRPNSQVHVLGFIDDDYYCYPDY